MMVKKEYKIPFVNGKPISFVGYEQNVVWKENLPFELKMTLEDYWRGRSAVRITMKGEDGHRYEMFMKDFMDMLKKYGLRENGEITGLWQFVKRGQNYALTYLGE